MKKITDLPIEGKKVLLRGDLDVTENKKRLEVLLPSIKLLEEQNASQIIILGHRGRPSSDEDKEQFSNKHLLSWFQENVSPEIDFQEDVGKPSESKLVLVENLRFWEGEENNEEQFVNQVAALGEVYINDAFAASHREHASIVGVPKLLPHAAGLRFAEEVEHLSKIVTDPARPLVSVLSGVKKDKLDYLDALIALSDKVLVAGRLPEYLGEDYTHEKVVMAHLVQDKEDITIHSIENFEQEIAGAKTIFVSGPVGKFEEEGHLQGTDRVFNAVAKADAFTVAGGGDSEAAIAKLGLEDKFDWISTGGGAMLEFITKGTLPGIIALENE